MPDLSQRLTTALSDRYRIERELGRGGMATVFLAEDLRHHRQVAIKVLDPEVAATIGSERFLREIETVARLTHPHIVPLHESGVADGLLFYVMPYIEGVSLRDRLTRERHLPLDDALRLSREVADALSYAHSRGVIHRDVKPENILIESGHAVVADFGIARAVAAAGGEKLTATGIAVGTPAYMSPEQAAGSRDLDGRSDLYSLGCVLYEMLAGQPPFTAPTYESLVHQHLNVSPRPVTEIRPAVPAAVAAALQRALAKNPADRFNPVALFGEAIGSGGGAPVTATARPRPRWPILMAGLVVVVAAAVVLWVVRGRRESPPAEPSPTHSRTEIAVLPLQNLSAGGPHAYFAGGLHEELLTQLAKVAALKIISRTSVMGYEGSKKSLKQIAAELGVGSIVEGSVQVVGNRLRVNVQLIDAATDEHLWAERYDRTLDDAFAIQSDVAQRIVAAVGAALGREEREAIAEAPTANPEAYRLYLQGQEYSRRPGRLREDTEHARQLYERALALDPGFALAHAALSYVHGIMYWYEYDPSPARAARQREEARSALRLAPNLAQAHWAMGVAHYWGHRDYRQALGEFRIALRARPNDAQVWEYVGYVQRRLGNWTGADSAYQVAVALDPRNVQLICELGGGTYTYMHRYADAVRAYDQALTLAPDFHTAAIDRGWAYVDWKGCLDTLRAALDATPVDARLGAEGTAALKRANLLLLERKPDDLLSLIRHAGAASLETQQIFVPALWTAWAHQLRRDGASARAAFGSALAMTDSAIAGHPDRWQIHAVHGMALAGLGRRQAAFREAQWLQTSAEYHKDAMRRCRLAELRARILGQAGYAEAALDEIERLLAGPSLLSVHTLQLDPTWDPIREHPRFKALLVKYANPEEPLH